MVENREETAQRFLKNAFQTADLCDNAGIGLHVEALDQRNVGFRRTQNVADPTGWRGWDGTDFSVQFIDPYTDSGASPAEHVCTPVSPAQLNPRMTASLTFNTYLNAWLLVDDSDEPDPASPGKRISGFYYAVSADLIHWSQRQRFLTSGILNNCDPPERWDLPPGGNASSLPVFSITTPVATRIR